MKILDLKIALARRKFLALAESAESVCRTNKLGIILDTEDEKAFNGFHRLKQDLKLEPNDFHLIFTDEKGAKNNIFDTPVITRKDFGWNGKSSDNFNAFLKADYDVLISFTASENKLANFLVSVMRARLKVGRLDYDEKGIFDLNISAELSSPEIFISEFKKYFKILNTTTA